MFTFLLNEKLKGTGITTNCLHPGYVRTNIGLNHFLLRILAPLIKYGAISLEEGSETSVYLASSSEVEGVTGKYYHKMKLKDPNKLAFDKKLQKELWDLSLKLTNLSSKII
jgi:NAD(P)-dependent dehydrogenase (short-subunit alcohol dehydrogenase family)